MQLLVHPDDGLDPILQAIESARRNIDMHIFRLDRKRIERALADSVNRGVAVRTLIAHTNGGGEIALRKLEQRLLAIGATVSRTADDLLRYHGKMMIVDRRRLYVLSYNLTRIDVNKSRCLGIATQKRQLVAESLKLFEADFDRKPYEGSAQDFLVSPVNSRERLAALIKGAAKELRIYGVVTDDAMIRLLKERARSGVRVRIIGKLEKGHEGLSAEKYPGKRLHVSAVARDSRAVFVGSQCLRKLELDKRREIGIVVKHPRVVKRILEIFEADWARTETGAREAREQEKRARAEIKEVRRDGEEVQVPA